MALNILGPTKSKYSVEEINEDVDLMLSEPFGEEYEKQFRSSLADRLQVGFLRSDKNTQSDETEILEIKLVSDTTKQLCEDIKQLKQDLHFSKQVVEAKYKEDLLITSNKLYEKLHHRLEELEKIHEEKVAVVRRSFKQQLQDALVKMTAYYKKYYKAKLDGKLAPTTKTNADKTKIEILQGELQNSQSMNQMFELQIEQLQAELAAKPNISEIKVDTSELDTLQEQNDNLEDEVSALNSKVEDLTDSLEFRDEKIQELNHDKTELKMKIEKEKEISRKLAQKLEDLTKEKDTDKHSARQEMERQRAAMEREMAAQLSQSQNATQNLEVQKQNILEECRKETDRLLLEQRLKYEEKLKQEKSLREMQAEELKEHRSFDQVLSQQKSEINILKQRLLRTNKHWEKKFAILRSSLHALKDESYIRLQLQKQAATLKYASINYGVDSNSNRQSAMPLSEQAPSINIAKPLPAIHSPSGGNYRKPATNTIPSGPGTEIFTQGAMDFADEQDVEESEIAEDFIPLPSPPIWQRQNFGDYMPSAPAPPQ